MRNKATKKNMDLDLRRYGNNLYSKAEQSGGGGDSDGGGDSVDINTILDNISIKDDLSTKLQAIDYTNQELGDILTDLTFDDVFNDYDDFIKSCLYREESPAITNILFPQDISVQKTNDCLEFRIGDEDAFYYVTVAIVDNDIKIYAMKQENNPK